MRLSSSERLTDGWLVRAYAWGLIAFLLLPMLVVVGSSFTASEFPAFPPLGWTTRWYEELARREEFIHSFGISVILALGTAVGSLVLGVTAALFLDRTPGGATGVTSALFLSPLMLPRVVIGLALLQFFVRLRVSTGLAAMLIGHLVIATPYVIRLALASLTGRDRDVERAAVNLGASATQVFFRVTLPLAAPGIIAGGVFAMIVSLDDAVVSLFLASPRITTLPVRIFSYVEQGSDALPSAVSAVVIVITAGLIVVLERTVGVLRLFR